MPLFARFYAGWIFLIHLQAWDSSMKSFLGLELVPESCLNLLQLPQSIRQLFVTTWCEEVSWPTWIKNSGSVKVSKDSILICQFHRFYQESIMWKIEIPSTILFKLVAHSSTENLVVVVVDRIDVAKPIGKICKQNCTSLIHLHIEFLAGGSISLPWPHTRGSRDRVATATTRFLAKSTFPRFIPPPPNISAAGCGATVKPPLTPLVERGCAALGESPV